jgi:hypothetical protein
VKNCDEFMQNFGEKFWDCQIVASSFWQIVVLAKRWTGVVYIDREADKWIKSRQMAKGNLANRKCSKRRTFSV